MLADDREILVSCQPDESDPRREILIDVSTVDQPP
jgi:hypothetical protein